MSFFLPRWATRRTDGAKYCVESTSKFRIVGTVCVLCIYMCVCVCMVTDFSAEDKARGVSGSSAYKAGNLPFLQTLLPQKPKIGRIGQRAGHEGVARMLDGRFVQRAAHA